MTMQRAARAALTFAFLASMLAVLAGPALGQEEDTTSITIRVFGVAVQTLVGDDCRPDPNDTSPLADVVISVGVPRTCTVTGLDSNGDETPTTFFASSGDTTIVRVDSVVPMPNDSLPGTPTSVIWFTPVGPGYTSIVVDPEPIQSAMGIIPRRLDPSSFTWMTKRADGLWCQPATDNCVEVLTERNMQLCWYRFVGSAMAGKSDSACPFDTPVLGDEVDPTSGVPGLRQGAQAG